jgi:hypothetical protein
MYWPEAIGMAVEATMRRRFCPRPSAGTLYNGAARFFRFADDTGH